MAITASLIAPIRAAYCLGGFDIPLLPYNENNSATFKDGSVLTIGAGVLAEATDADPTTQIAGIAVQAGQNIASAPLYPKYGLVYPSGAGLSQASSVVGSALAVAPLLVVPALPHVVFEGTLANEGNDAAVATTDVWAKAGLAKDSGTGLWYVDKGDTTTLASVLIIGVKNPQDITFGTTTGARVFFCILTAQSAFGLAS